MAIQQKTINTILFILLGLAIIIGLIALWPKKEDATQPPINPPPPTTSGLGGALGGILSGVFAGDWWKKIFGGKKDEYPVVDCDPARPGYEKDGTVNPNCGKDYTGCVQGKCDPKRPGFDECGFLDVNC